MLSSPISFILIKYLLASIFNPSSTNNNEYSYKILLNISFGFLTYLITEYCKGGDLSEKLFKDPLIILFTS